MLPYLYCVATGERLELSRLIPQESKSCVFTNSTIPHRLINSYLNHLTIPQYIINNWTFTPIIKPDLRLARQYQHIFVQWWIRPELRGATPNFSYPFSIQRTMTIKDSYLQLSGSFSNSSNILILAKLKAFKCCRFPLLVPNTCVIHVFQRFTTKWIVGFPCVNILPQIAIQGFLASARLLFHPQG